jgi:hypothetical protein
VIVTLIRAEERHRGTGFLRVHGAPDDPLGIEDAYEAALVLLPPSAWQRGRDQDTPAIKLAADIFWNTRVRASNAIEIGSHPWQLIRQLSKISRTSSARSSPGSQSCGMHAAFCSCRLRRRTTPRRSSPSAWSRSVSPGRLQKNCLLVRSRTAASKSIMRWRASTRTTAQPVANRRRTRAPA